MGPASFCIAGKAYQVREAWLEHQVLRPETVKYFVSKNKDSGR